MYRVTVDGGAQIMRPNANLPLIAARLLEQPDGRRHVRETARPHVVATADLQRKTFAVFIHGNALPPAQWPMWAHELAKLLDLPTNHPILPKEHP